MGFNFECIRSVKVIGNALPKCIALPNVKVQGWISTAFIGSETYQPAQQCNALRSTWGALHKVSLS